MGQNLLALKQLHLLSQHTVGMVLNKHIPWRDHCKCSLMVSESLQRVWGRINLQPWWAGSVRSACCFHEESTWPCINETNYLRKYPTPQSDSSIFILCLTAYESKCLIVLAGADSQLPRLTSHLACNLVFLALFPDATRHKQSIWPCRRGRWPGEHFTLGRRCILMNQNSQNTWIWIMECIFRAAQLRVSCIVSMILLIF